MRDYRLRAVAPTASWAVPPPTGSEHCLPGYCDSPSQYHQTSGMQEVFTPTWSKSLIVLVTSGIVLSSSSTLPPTPLSSKGTTPCTTCFVPWSCTLA
ncbi:hypothetical protein C4D60_Mb02t02120 [Musa balbisiana]|uniref:Uncharacterized protein n=1 Tax=Musa balbisiana TaxID=52838 RepID=A0A4S8I7L8_MUSBA|nr:hypothetical protein C4D60_Mb02t02120 [Musa balbisiana]